MSAKIIAYNDSHLRGLMLNLRTRYVTTQYR